MNLSFSPWHRHASKLRSACFDATSFSKKWCPIPFFKYIVVHFHAFAEIIHFLTKLQKWCSVVALKIVGVFFCCLFEIGLVTFQAFTETMPLTKLQKQKWILRSTKNRNHSRGRMFLLPLQFLASCWLTNRSPKLIHTEPRPVIGSSFYKSRRPNSQTIKVNRKKN